MFARGISGFIFTLIIIVSIAFSIVSPGNPNILLAHIRIWYFLNSAAALNISSLEIAFFDSSIISKKSLHNLSKILGILCFNISKILSHSSLLLLWLT